MASPSSSTSFFGIMEEDPNQIKQQHHQHQSSSTPVSSTAPSTVAPAPKKKRNLPGTPNPDAEVIALSPKSLLATNRFICEVCNKGFQREQNLQLHRRGHNLPWKLKQKTNKEVRKKVYLCPEPTCVHHDPSRALGDLTGIKKHFCRKHGEKKWKCDKCSKRYAVQSDWKAHSKTCGTKEYRCDCGTLFSRRDSFITHRAFCDALAQESARLPTGLATMAAQQLYSGSSNMALGLSQGPPHLSPPSTDLLRLSGAGGTQFDHLLPPNPNPSSFRPPPSQSPSLFLQTEDHQPHHALMQNKQPFHGLMHHSDASNAAASNLFNLGFFSNSSSTSTMHNTTNNSNNTHIMTSSGLILQDQFGGPKMAPEVATTLFSGNIGAGNLYSSSMASDSLLPQMSATALLQKAAQMGVATNNTASRFRGLGSSSPSTGTKPQTSMNLSSAYFGDNMKLQMDNEANLQDLMNSFTTTGSGMFGGNSSSSGLEREFGFGGFNPGRLSMDQESKLHHNLSVSTGGSDGLTRDFLGVGRTVGGMQQRDYSSLRGMGMGSFDQPEMKSEPSSGSRHFRGRNVQ